MRIRPQAWKAALAALSLTAAWSAAPPNARGQAPPQESLPCGSPGGSTAYAQSFFCYSAESNVAASVGDFARAAALSGRALELRTADLQRLAKEAGVPFSDFEHGDYEVIMGDHARNLQALGRYGEAEALFKHLEDISSTIAPLYDLARLYAATGRHTEAERAFKRILAAIERRPGTPATVIGPLLADLADLYIGSGRYAEAEPLLKRARALAEGRLGRAKVEILEQAQSFNHYFHPPGEAATNPQLAQFLAYLKILGTDIGGRLFLAPGEQGGLTPSLYGVVNLYARSISALGELYASTGRDAEAALLLNGALAIQEYAFMREQEIARSSELLGSFFARTHNEAQAEPLLRRALEIREKQLGANHPATLSAQKILADLLLRQAGRGAEALPLARAAVAGVRVRRDALGFTPDDEAQLQREAGAQAGYYALLADALWSSSANPSADLRAEAFAALQDAMAGVTSQAVTQMAARNAAEGVGAGLGELARRRQALSDAWRAGEAAYANALSQTGPQVALKLETLKRRQGELETEMKQIDARLRTDFPAYFAMTRPRAISVSEAQALLAPDEAALIVVPTPYGTHVMAVTRGGVFWNRSAMPAAGIDAAVKRLREDLSPGSSAPNPAAAAAAAQGQRSIAALRAASTSNDAVAAGYRSFDRATAYLLYRELIAPMRQVLAGKKHVFIAADGTLSVLPFSVLVTADPQGDDADPAVLRATQWFADAHALIQLPSLQALYFLRTFAARRSGGSSANGFAGFGNPVLNGQAVERGKEPSRPVDMASLFAGRNADGGGIADTEQIRGLNSLPGTAVELESLRAAFGAPASALHLQEGATETAVRSADLSQDRVLAFATHGVLAGQIRGVAEPGLILTPPATASDRDDGLLTASEITTLTLHADWVILSACNTAAGDGSSSTGLSGLARAFFYAGAKSLLASHWPVRDDVAARIVADTIRRQQQNGSLSRAQAFQAAMRDIRNSPQDATTANPAAWAPFSLIGNPD